MTFEEERLRDEGGAHVVPPMRKSTSTSAVDSHSGVSHSGASKSPASPKSGGRKSGFFGSLFGSARGARKSRASATGIETSEEQQQQRGLLSPSSPTSRNTSRTPLDRAPESEPEGEHSPLDVVAKRKSATFKEA